MQIFIKKRFFCELVDHLIVFRIKQFYHILFSQKKKKNLG